MAQATDSRTRWRNGTQRALEGVPVLVKDQIDVQNYPTSLGTQWRAAAAAAAQNAAVVANLRAMGAMIVGKTNMHELGGGVTGINPKFGAALGAYSGMTVPSNRAGGGSSGGSATALAMSLTPVSIGSDAGGSIRIPGSFNALFALKPTFGRMSDRGVYPLAPTLSQPGPFANNTRDLAAMYIAMAGAPNDYKGFNGPGLALGPETDLRNFSGMGQPLIVGRYDGWISRADAATRAAFQQALTNLTNSGANVRQIDPAGRGISKLEWNGIAQIILYATEMTPTVTADANFNRAQTSAELRIALAMGALAGRDNLGSDLGANDVTIARKIRAELSQAVEQVFCAGVDVIATPATGIVAPVIRNDAFPDGESDLGQLSQINMFATLANVTGHPAITIPIGFDADGNAIGMQLIGRAWSEGDLLRIAHVYEQYVTARAATFYNADIQGMASEVWPP
jgi:Asp-tRNA(Asn)/Glu-tRNA(Gln) amidotransferase A subunit family amidase